MTNIHGIMTRLTLGALALALAVTLVGCGRDGTPGGPGATDPTAKPPLYGEADNTFNPTASSVSLKQGNTEKGVDHDQAGDELDQDVTISGSRTFQRASPSPPPVR